VRSRGDCSRHSAFLDMTSTSRPALGGGASSRLLPACLRLLAMIVQDLHHFSACRCYSGVRDSAVIIKTSVCAKPPSRLRSSSSVGTVGVLAGGFVADRLHRSFSYGALLPSSPHSCSGSCLCWRFNRRRNSQCSWASIAFLLCPGIRPGHCGSADMMRGRARTSVGVYMLRRNDWRPRTGCGWERFDLFAICKLACKSRLQFWFAAHL